MNRPMNREYDRRTTSVGSVLPVLPPRLALVEIALLLVVPILLEYFVAAFPDLTSFNPHPYWGPVLLLSLQYGTVSGLLAAIVAIAGTALIGFTEPDIGENHFAYMIRVWTQPFLWITASLLLGHFRMQHIEHRNELLHRVDDLQSQSSALADYATNLQLRCDGLERRIASRSSIRGGQVLENLAALTAAAPAELSATFHQLIQATLPGAAASLFAREPDQLTVVATSGWPAGARWRKTLSIGEPLASCVIGEVRSLSILVAADDSILAGEGLLALPIIAPDSGVVVGMLKVETLASSAVLSSSTERQLRFIAGHLGGALRHSVRTQSTSPTQAVDPMVEDSAAPKRRWRQMRWFTGGAAAPDPLKEAEPTTFKKPTVAGR